MHTVVVDDDSSLLPRDDNQWSPWATRCSVSTMPRYSFVSFENVVNRLWSAGLKALPLQSESIEALVYRGRQGNLSITASHESPCICGHLTCVYEEMTFRQTIHLTYICKILCGEFTCVIAFPE